MVRLLCIDSLLSIVAIIYVGSLYDHATFSSTGSLRDHGALHRHWLTLRKMLFSLEVVQSCLMVRLPLMIRFIDLHIILCVGWFFISNNSLFFLETSKDFGSLKCPDIVWGHGSLNGIDIFIRHGSLHVSGASRENMVHSNGTAHSPTLVHS